VILTNYQFYADAFALIGRERMQAGHPNGGAFVEPGSRQRLPVIREIRPLSCAAKKLRRAGSGTRHQCEMCFGGLTDTQVRSRRFGLGRLLDLPAWNIALAVLIAAAIIALTHGA
jgi:hypothetical protein